VAAAAARLAADGADTVWGAFVGGELAGIVGLGREARAKVRHKATVFGMYVADEHAGRGLGTALLQQAIAAARAESLEQLLLTVTATNAGARALYEKAGFRPFGTEPRATRIGSAYHDKTHMILFLTPP